MNERVAELSVSIKFEIWMSEYSLHNFSFILVSSIA